MQLGLSFNVIGAGDLLIELDNWPAAIAPAHIDDAIARDPEQPGRERPAAIFILGQPFQHAHKDFAAEVFSQIWVAYTGKNKSEQHRPVKLINVCNGNMIA